MEADASVTFRRLLARCKPPLLPIMYFILLGAEYGIGESTPETSVL